MLEVDKVWDCAPYIENYEIMLKDESMVMFFSKNETELKLC